MFGRSMRIKSKNSCDQWRRRDTLCGMSRRMNVTLSAILFAFMAFAASDFWVSYWATMNEPIANGTSPEEAEAIVGQLRAACYWATMAAIFAALVLHGAISGWSSRIVFRIGPIRKT